MKKDIKIGYISKHVESFSKIWDMYNNCYELPTLAETLNVVDKNDYKKVKITIEEIKEQYLFNYYIGERKVTNEEIKDEFAMDISCVNKTPYVYAMIKRLEFLLEKTK